MRPQTIDVILFHDTQSKPARYYVSVKIGKRQERQLFRSTDVREAAAYMNRWIRGRGYEWGPDSARRVSEAQRSDSVFLVLTACDKRGGEDER